MKSTNFILENQTLWEHPAKGIKRQIMGFNEDIMLVKVFFEKGAVGTPHEHFHTQTTYVASGVFEIEIKGEKKLLRQGDGFFVEADAYHGALCIEEGILIDVFTPMRADFLK